MKKEITDRLHRFTSKDLCKMIHEYVVNNGIESLTIELQKNWDSGILMNVQVNLKEDVRY